MVSALGIVGPSFAFSYSELVKLPTISGVLPLSGPPVGGTLVRIIGSNFRVSGEVRFVEVDPVTLIRSSTWSLCDVQLYTDTEIRCVRHRCQSC